MKKFLRFITPGLFVLFISSSIFSQGKANRSGNQPWAINCKTIGTNCMENYPKFFDNVERTLSGSAAFYESIGFNNGIFLIRTVSGTKSKSLTGPYFVIKPYSENKGELACDSDPGEVASYATGGSLRGAIMLDNFAFYNMFDNDDKKEKLEKPCPYKPDNLDQLVISLSHEVFHGYQHSAKDLQNPPGQRSNAIAWIDEATAEAAAFEYSKKAIGTGRISDGNYFYDLPLHDDDPNDSNKGYRRGHFMYEVGKIINPSSPLQWILNIYDKEPKNTRYGYDWLDEAFKDAGQKNLSEAYINFIAKKADKEKLYKGKPKNVAVIRRDDEPVKKTVLNDIMATEPFYADYKASVFRSVSDTLPGESVALLEINVKPKDADRSPILVVEKEVAEKEDRKKYVALAALNDKPKKLFSRVVNAPATKDDTEKLESDIEISAKSIQILLTNCMSPGKIKQISFEPEMPEDIDIKMSAKYGTIDKNFNYTAPSREVIDELKIELLVGETKTEMVIFARPRITRRGCQFRLTGPDGYRITFDPGIEATKTEDIDRRNFAVFDREFAYYKASSTGWLKMRPSQMQTMLLRMGVKSATGFPSVVKILGDVLAEQKSNMGDDPLKWGKAPYDFLDRFERSKLNKHISKDKKKRINDKIKRARRKEPCPSSGGQCTVYTIDGVDGESKVYYDRRNRIDAFSTKGANYKVEYGAFIFEVPKNAQLIKF